ncbi:LysM domain-containing protein [uncultured Cellulomonas sp.]|uniref:LysM peptidoglycan-binding domain-containing protein n=1 Tax=uncultured Cellulomonas sp. TaxID=189682 RepID=UPI0028E342A8|nr:LysM domain-containing protein [uncultured Cellulomonas sp.]
MRIDGTHSKGGRDARRQVGTTTGLLVGVLATGSLAVVLAVRLRAGLLDSTGPWRVDTVVELGVTAIGLVVALWLACSALLATTCLVARAAGASWHVGERLVHRYAPQLVRRALAVAVGATLGLGAVTGASAAAPTPAPPTAAASVASDDGSVDLGWVVTEAPADPRPAPSVTTPAAPATAATPPPDVPVLTAAPAPAADQAPTTGSTVVVAPGDSLWGIAARHLPAGATDAEVAAAWPRWYEANATVIGADPDVILPGQVLTVPVGSDGGAR